MSDQERFEALVSTWLSTTVNTEHGLDDAINKVRTMFPDLTDDQVAQTKRRLTERHSIQMDLGVAVTAAAFAPWLEARTTTEWRHWLAYKSWLTLEQGWSLGVIDTVDRITDRILDYAGDPTLQGTWARRGLVIGDVQSGKTATYLALFNKAVDAGYRLVIVLAGGTEILRQQTQQRVDEGLIGRDSRGRGLARQGTHAPSPYVGVGRRDNTIADATGLTTVAQDFRKTSYEASNIRLPTDSRNAYVFVLKKNKTVLNTLARWLDDQPKVNGRIPLPVLLLDDESDYASVNTREETSPTAINKAIRDLLGKFSRSSYLAFTATPFANIFIDSDQEDDLFPRDYVYSLQSPTNYFGSKATFGTADQASENTIVELDDAEDWLPVGHRSSAHVEQLSDSLLDAIRTFFISNAIRDLRGDQGPRSMLVNVSRYRAVQRQVHELIRDEASMLRNALDLHAIPYGQGIPNQTIDELRMTFERHYSGLDHSWTQVLGVLRNANARVEVQLYNSDRDRALMEQSRIMDVPPRMIAVGGDVLSRGLTLPGLAISYFHRRVGAFDTLMQMARWFGYRDGYADLCRVWIGESVAAQYRFVQDAIDELRFDLEVMHQQRLSPSDFGLSVKKHPGSLLVTARNKMRAAAESRKQISLAGRRVESTRLSAADDHIDGNLEALSRLMSRLAGRPTTPDPRARPLWQGVPKEIVAEFLQSFRTSDDEPLFAQGALATFVRTSRAEHLQRWDVIVVNGDRKKTPVPLPGTSTLMYHPPERRIELLDGVLRVAGSSSRLASPDDIPSLVDEADRATVEERFRERKTRALEPDRTEPTKAVRGKPGEVEYYDCLPRPVLLIYPLQARESADVHDDGRPTASSVLRGRPLVAAKIAIMRRGTADSSADVTYVINRVAQRNWLPEFVEEDDDDLDQ